VANCWPTLKEQVTWPDKYIDRAVLIEDVFCRSGGCPVMVAPFDFRVSCLHLEECVKAFDTQVTEEGDAEAFLNCGWDNHDSAYLGKNYPYKNKSKQNKAVYKPKAPDPEPVAVFITNGDAKWREKMAKVLNANNG
jgi:hypothetical protein